MPEATVSLRASAATPKVRSGPTGAMHPLSDRFRDMRVGVVGAGRLGSALAPALAEAGLRVAGPLGRDETPERCDAVLLCVPDAEIPAAAAAVAGAAPLMGHTSGATPLAALEPAGGAAFGLHPLQTFAPGDGAEAFRGAGCAVAGCTPAALAFAV